MQLANVHVPHLQAYSLDFISKYLQSGLKKTKIHDCNLVELLFSTLFFQVDSNNPAGISAQENWNRIWDSLISVNSNLEWIPSAVVKQLKFSQGDFQYLRKMNTWIHEQFEINPLLLELFIQNGLLEEILAGIFTIHNVTPSIGFLTEFFVMIKSIICMMDINIPIHVSEKLVDLMLKDSLIFDPSISELSLSCIVLLIRYQGLKSYAKYLEMLERSKDNFEAMKRLMENIQDILKDSHTRKNCQDNFVNAGIMGMLKEILKQSYLQEFTAHVWVSALECIRFLIQENDYCKQSLQEINFKQLSVVLSSENFSKKKSEICELCMEILLYILFSSTNLEILHEVLTPQVIPLVLAMFCHSPSPFYKYILDCMDLEVNSAYFSFNFAVEILLEGMVLTDSSKVLSFIEEMLGKVIPCHVTPLDMRKIIVTGTKSNSEKQMLLFKGINKGFSNSFQRNSNKNQKIPMYKINETNYFWFRDPNSFIQLTSDTFDFLPKKDFTIILWIFPFNRQKGCILDFTDGKSQFIVYTSDKCIEIEQISEKKIVSKITTTQVLYENQWNLLCISFQQITKLISSVNILQLFVNNKLCEKVTEGKTAHMSANFSSLFIGNSSTLKRNFQGKVSLCVICNKYFSDFSSIYSLHDDFYLPFISEATSIFQSVEKKFSKDLAKFKHFEYFSHFPELIMDGIQVKNQAFTCNGVNIVSSLITLGGLKSFLPIFKDNYMDEHLVLEILKTFMIFTRATSVNALIPKDFFQVLSTVIENNSCPSGELLELIREMLMNLEWNPAYQREIFVGLMLNSKIWNCLSKSTHDKYLEVLLEYSAKHIECRLEPCASLYSHLIAMSPVPDSLFVEFFAKVLPRSLIIGENIDALSYLLFKMLHDKPELTGLFLEEISLIKIEKTSCTNMLYLMLHFLECIQKASVQAGLLRVIKTIALSLISSTKEKTMSEIENLMLFTMNDIDKKLDKSLSLEVFQALMDIIITSFSLTTEKTSDFFGMFIDIITKRFIYLGEPIKAEILKATTDYQFCGLIIDRENFPNWLSNLFIQDSQSAISHGLLFFSKKVSVVKLRKFLISISRQDFNIGLFFYKQVLSIVISQKLLKIEEFLDFASILEDLLNPDMAGRANINIEEYVEVLELLVSHSEELEVLHCTFPPVPFMDFSLQYELLKQRPLDISPNEKSVYLREGGFLRLILKYLLIGLNTSPCPPLLILLGHLLNLSPSITLNPDQKQLTDKLLSDCSTERYSLAYSKFPTRERDILFSEKFLTFYILVEFTEILATTADKEVADSILKFLEESNVDEWIIMWSKKITSKELEDVQKMMKEYKFLFFTTARARLAQMERNGYLQMMSQSPVVSLQTFQTSILEQMECFNKAKKSEEGLRDLLISPNWICRIHLFLVAYTSMKLNFIGFIAATQIMTIKPIVASIVPSEDYNAKLTNFIITKQDDLKAKYSSFITTQEKLQQVLHQRFINIFQEYRKIDTIFQKGKFKLRWNLDRAGKMGICSKKKNEERLSIRRSKTITIPSEQMYKTSILLTLPTENSISESADESEIGTVFGDIDEEALENPIIELHNTVRCECERIKISYSVFGEIEISQMYLLFTTDGLEKPLDGKFFGSALKFTQELKKVTKLIEVDEVCEVFSRRFIHKHTAFEIFLKSGHSYFFNVFTPEARENIFQVIKSWRHVKVFTEISQVRAFTNKWRKGLISNLEYILILNKFASRSFNDISQYPVFPWVLKDYCSADLKLEDPHIYRNFKLPIGAQTESSRQEADRRFSMWIDEQPYHFGSHYSSGAVVLHYLVRIEPFTTQARLLQGGKFDIADRLFHSIESSWESGQAANGDVKELVPELYYLPEILSNINNEDFGAKQDDKEVFHVELPRWAHSPFDFIRKHRLALESNYVSSQLNHWIDLIFGFKQRGKHAQNSYNLYCPMTYEENFVKVLDSNESESYQQGMVEQVVHFGQTPIRLFKKPHTSCDSKAPDQNIFDKYRKYSELVSNGCETNGEICALLICEGFLVLVKNVSGRMSVIRISLNEFDGNRVVFEKKKEKFLQGSRPSTPSSEEYYCMWNENYVVSASQLDKSFKVHSLAGVIEASVFSHTDMVTSVCEIGGILVTGGADSSMYSWEAKHNEKNLNVAKYCSYLGHNAKITQIRGLENLQIVVSLAEDFNILIHDLRNGECIRGFKNHVKAIRTNNLGLIAFIKESEIEILTVNGSSVLTKQFKVNKMIFDKSGENLFYCYENTWGFFNLFDEHKKFEQAEELPILHLQLPSEGQYFIHSQVGEKTNFVLTFELISKETLRVIRRHNLLQD